MKRACLILVMSLLLGELLATSDSLFQSANLLYQEGKYELALEDYRQISESGFAGRTLLGYRQYINTGSAVSTSGGKTLLRNCKKTVLVKGKVILEMEH